MDTANMTGMLAFGTLIAALLLAVIVWVRFMRKPQNRHPMEGERERNIQEIRNQEPGSPDTVNDPENNPPQR